VQATRRSFSAEDVDGMPEVAANKSSIIEEPDICEDVWHLFPDLKEHWLKGNGKEERCKWVALMETGTTGDCS
jgi:hypothetical protein